MLNFSSISRISCKMSETRAKKLTALQEFCNLETGVLHYQAFREEDILRGKGRMDADVVFVGEGLREMLHMEEMGFPVVAGLRLSEMRKEDCYWWEVGRDNDKEELQRELDKVRPELVVVLGEEGKGVVSKVTGEWKVLQMKHPGVLRNLAPEKRYGWVVKLSLEIDKCINMTS